MPTNPAQISLASGSPRRRELLDQIGIQYRLLKISVDESAVDDELPLHYVERLARAKADEGYLSQSDLPVLGADTCVVIDNEILGKPETADHALQQLQQLSGRTHQVYTAVAVRDQRCISCVQISNVKFHTLNLQQCQRYVAAGESLDKAGSYAVQGLAASFIEHIDGSFSGIMGLPLFETTRLLGLAGIRVW